MATDRVAALERALCILDCFTPAEPALGLAELAKRTGLYKSTILRLAASLQRFGYLQRHADGLFRLGPAVWRLGALYREHFDLEATIRPALVELVEATQETASLYVRDGSVRVCLFRQNPSRPIAHRLVEGERLPLDLGAPGRVLQAFGGAAGPIYDAVRQAGHYVSRGERVPEVGAIAVPVFDSVGALRGSFAVSAPIHRLDARLIDRAVPVLKAVSGRIGPTLPPE